MKFIKSYGISDRGNITNEDIFNIVENAAWVLDGATGLTKNKISDFESDASWYVDRWNKYLTKNINKNCSLKDIIKEGLRLIKNEYEGLSGFRNLTYLEYPCAAISIIRLRENKLEYFILGDCTVAYKIGENNIIELYDKKLESLEEIILNKIKRISIERKIDVLEAKQFCLNDIKDTRKLKNTKDGYWILELDEEAVNHALVGEISLSEDIRLFMTSDGASQHYDTLNISSNSNEFLVKLESSNLNSIIDEIRESQNKDKFCSKYPRLKKSDDATIVYIKISN
ncbi:hypothetical protein JCM1393_15010 [Clostridium carnis]